MNVLKQQGEDNITYKGKIFEIVQKTMVKGDKKVVFEMARRAPGVRLIIPDYKNKTLLLTREHRYELNDFDYRLPGGKVFDTLDEFEEYRASGKDIVKAAKVKALEELQEEAGVEAKDVDLVRISTLGATVGWDLYVFEAVGWKAVAQNLGVGEHIETATYSFADAEKMILEGKMQEERIALILLQWLKQQ